MNCPICGEKMHEDRDFCGHMTLREESKDCRDGCRLYSWQWMEGSERTWAAGREFVHLGNETWGEYKAYLGRVDDAISATRLGFEAGRAFDAPGDVATRGRELHYSGDPRWDVVTRALKTLKEGFDEDAPRDRGRTEECPEDHRDAPGDDGPGGAGALA